MSRQAQLNLPPDWPWTAALSKVTHARVAQASHSKSSTAADIAARKEAACVAHALERFHAVLGTLDTQLSEDARLVVLIAVLHDLQTASQPRNPNGPADGQRLTPR